MLLYLFLLVHNTIERFIEFIIYLFSEHATIQAPIQESPETIYINKQKYKFMSTFHINKDDNINDDTKNFVNWNENIETEFYNKKAIHEILKDVVNPIEQKWKTRILMENTPKGNVVMYYDAYKEGFAYYSNEIIPYPILNAVSMKYVVTYRCRDFFKDESVLTEPSPLVVAHRNQEKEDAKEKSRKISITKEELEGAPFIKKRKIEATTSTIDASGNKDNTDSKEKNKMINKFIWYGKMNEFSFLKKVDKKKTAIKKLLFQDLLENNKDDFITASVSSPETIQPFSYKDYKKKMTA